MNAKTKSTRNTKRGTDGFPIPTKAEARRANKEITAMLKAEKSSGAAKVTKQIVKAAAKAAKARKAAAPVTKEVAAARSQAAYKAHLSRQAKALAAAKSAEAKKEANTAAKEIGARLAAFQRQNAKLLKSAS